MSIYLNQNSKIIVKLPKTPENREVAAFAIMRLEIPTDFFVEKVRDIATFKKSEKVLQIGKFSNPPRIEDLAGDLFEKLARAIVAFEMPIDRIEGQFKLGQNRSQDDRLGMLRGLDAEKSHDAGALAAFIRETLESDGGVERARD